MTYKICQVIFSTNRLEYLIPTLRAQKNLDFSGCVVDKIFIDDYPKTRNNIMLESLVKQYDYNELYFHKENKGLSVTWTEFWDLIKDRDYDYIWHQEDDVEILETIKITDLIELLSSDERISQIQLSRQKWYQNEEDPKAEESDLLFKNFRFDKNRIIFSPMASLYSKKIVDIDFKKYYNFNLNEGAIGSMLYEHFGMLSCNVRNKNGNNLIRHIGEYFVGKRVLENEPGYEMFSKYNPDKKYSSRTGQEFK
jgi:hypothetical protein